MNEEDERILQHAIQHYGKDQEMEAGKSYIEETVR